MRKGNALTTTNKEYLDMQCEEKRKNVYSRKLDESFLKKINRWVEVFEFHFPLDVPVLKIKLEIVRIIRNINPNTMHLRYLSKYKFNAI